MQSTFELKRWETEVAQKIVVVQKISKFHNPPIDGFCTRDQKPELLLLYLPTPIRFLIGGKCVTCHWSKIHDALGRRKLHDPQGQQRLRHYDGLQFVADLVRIPWDEVALVDDASEMLDNFNN